MTESRAWCSKRSTAFHSQLTFVKAGIEAVHVGDRGLVSASDAKILEIAKNEARVVVTLWTPISGAMGPSAIRIRIEGLRGEDLAQLLVAVLEVCKDDLKAGAMISVTEDGVRVRKLPLFN